MGIKIVSYNMHGFNQGHSQLISLCNCYDVIFIQEHWLYPEQLPLLDIINEQFMSI